jgi:histidinol-phosphatase
MAGCGAQIRVLCAWPRERHTGPCPVAARWAVHVTVRAGTLGTGTVVGMTVPAVDRQLLDLAVTVAHRAGSLAAERFFEAGFVTRAKEDGTEVTDVDLAVEELIRTELLRRAPDDEIYGEEAGTTAGVSGRRWIIDPIDGTVYFARRIPLFSTLIAYEDEHGPAIGVINRPVARQMVFAGRGLGCWVRTGQAPDRRPVLRDNTGLRRALTQLVNPATWHGELLAALHQNVWITGYLGGVTGVLTGVLDAVVMAGSPQGYEDLAPLPGIMAEAGGRVTDLSGGPVLSGRALPWSAPGTCTTSCCAWSRTCRTAPAAT